ncbi:MAG TPA: hypothetical protein VE967_03230 [Gemmatimonadaceae bacterium]|nr:hypothetical protein [Gemmatimonadaceae bacterium]
MVSREDIEQFLNKLAAEGATWRDVEPGLWVIRPTGSLDLDIVVNQAPPVLLLRVKVMDLPKDAAEVSRLYRQLLEWNANDLVHGSYGIQDEAVVLTDALELSHLDYDEFRAAYESMTLALPEHLRVLSSYQEAR